MKNQTSPGFQNVGAKVGHRHHRRMRIKYRTWFYKKKKKKKKNRLSRKVLALESMKWNRVIKLAATSFLKMMCVIPAIDGIRAWSANLISFNVSRRADEKSRASRRLISLTRQRSIDIVDSPFPSPSRLVRSFRKAVTFLDAIEFLAIKRFVRPLDFFATLFRVRWRGL